MNEKIDTCYICQGPPTGAVGAQVQGDTATGDYWLFGVERGCLGVGVEVPGMI